ncbi:MAG: bifunctional precorrin-2 dehydrogenase/sirohydrochlorin ferrochelatase [Caldimicrobium sp.]
MTKYYPIFLKLENKLVVVIGGGQVAERKILTLLDRGAKIKVISPELTNKLKNLVKEGKILWEKKEYEKGDLEGAFIVIGATNNPMVQEEIYKEAEEKGIPCNIVDKPQYCSFIVPSLIERGDLTLAISTGGASPAVAKRLRERLESILGEEYELYLKLMRKIREEILKSPLSQEEKEKKLQIFALAPIPEYIKEKNLKILEVLLTKEGLSHLIPEMLFLCTASKDT